MPKVSIVIPIYGVEKYIEKCVRSLFEQTFDDIEYIFVNDCTKDSSMHILQSVIEDYPNRKLQIQIINHSQNKGLPQARKTGILFATGDYIINFDSDDWVDRLIIEKLYNQAIHDFADVVICDIYKTDGSFKNVVKGCDKKLSQHGIIEQMCQMKYTWSVCNKLIRKELFENVIFPDRNNAEDMALTLQILSKSNIISYVDLPLYYYYYNTNSITNTNNVKSVIKNIDDQQCNNELVFKSIQDCYDSFKSKLLCNTLKWQTKKYALSILFIDKSYYRFWRSIYSEINISLFFNPYIDFKDKLKCLLTHLGLYPRI